MLRDDIQPCLCPAVNEYDHDDGDTTEWQTHGLKRIQ